MSYSQSEVPGPIKHSLTPVLPWTQKLVHTIPVARSPFLKPSFLRKKYKQIMLSVSRLIQRVFKTKLYCFDDKAVLYQLTPETRSLLSWLSQRQLLESWNIGRYIPGAPSIKALYLRPTPVTTPSGGYFPLVGANGVGAGDTMQAAELSALGEFIERNAAGSYWWENNKIFSAPYTAGSRSLVDPDAFRAFTDEQLDKHVSYLNRYTPGQVIQWAPARDFETGRRVSVPAVMAYTFFKFEHKDQPFLQEISSSGCAAYTSYKEACVRALLESVERHVFMKMWYQRRKGRGVSLESLASVFAEAGRLLELVTDERKIYILDITDELGIPTILAVVTNTQPGATALHITAATDLNINDALQKTLKETIRFLMENYGVAQIVERPNSFYNDYQAMQAEAPSLRHRGVLWTDVNMLSHVDWIVEKVSMSTYEEIAAQHQSITQAAGATEDSRYTYLKKFLRQHTLRAYVVDVTNSVARYAGLKVVRVLSPDLIPISFNEATLPLRCKAFTHDSDGAPVDLNPIPHPFL